jgi:uncharacterized Zn finger protein
MNRREVYLSERYAATRQQLLGEEWWTTEFLDMMNPVRDTSQLIKGRRLAERGQVIVRSVYSGGVEAIVLETSGGSRKVSLWLTDLEDKWEDVFHILSGQQTLFSKLITGNYPEELDDILKQAGILIIPTTLMDLDYRCDCESGHHTCSHIVATYMALGTYVNEDPMTLFLLRGRTREEILAGVSSVAEQEITADEIKLPEEICTDSEPADPTRYYEPGPEIDLIRFRRNYFEGKEVDLIRMLGPSPFRLGRSDLADIISEMYPKAARYVKNFGIHQESLHKP